MSWFRADRRPRPGADRFLHLKLGCFAAGAIAALLGIGLERDWLITAALVFFAIGFLLRFYPADREPPAE